MTVLVLTALGQVNADLWTSLSFVSVSFPWISFGSLLHKSFSTKWRTASQWAALAHLQKCGHLFGILPVAQGQEAADRVRTCDWISCLNYLQACCSCCDFTSLLLKISLSSLDPELHALRCAVQDYRRRQKVLLCRRRSCKNGCLSASE